MSEPEPTPPDRPRSSLVILAGRERERVDREAQAASAELPITFDRRELRIIFDLYGAKVALGEWRDYALDFTPAKAVFSIFRRSCEVPLYRIEKNPALARRQGPFGVIAATGLVLRRGHDLARVIAVLDRKLKLVSRD